MYSYFQSTDTRLHIAAKNGDAVLVQQLLDDGVDINATDENKLTPIIHAAKQGHAEVISILLDNNADYKKAVLQNTDDDFKDPLVVAAINGNGYAVKVLLSISHSSESFKKAMHYSFSEAMRCSESEKRHRLFDISSMLKETLDKLARIDKLPQKKILTANDGKIMTWSEAYLNLFSMKPGRLEKNPDNKPAAIRHALASMYQLLQHPENCIPYITFLSEELKSQWEKEKLHPFRKFDRNMIDLCKHEGMLWPIPNNKYRSIRKNHLLDRVLLDKFHQYGMGSNQYKWTGFLPLKLSMELLRDNAFFNENRKTINGLFHGNVHNIQRVILLFAMECFDISLSYTSPNNIVEEIKPAEVFSSLMKKDIFPEDKQGSILWSTVLDIIETDYATFSHPYRMHSLLLTDKRFSGFLQDYMLYSFCDQFIRMRELHNHVYGTSYNNMEMFMESKKLIYDLFGGAPEFAIQLDERCDLKLVDKIDTMKKGEKKWSNQKKNYQPLQESVKKYSLNDEDEISALFSYNIFTTSSVKSTPSENKRKFEKTGLPDQEQDYKKRKIISNGLRNI